MNKAAKQAELNITALINNVDPEFNWKQYAAKIGAAFTYGAVVGLIGGYILEGTTLLILSATGSATAALIAYILGLAAIIYLVVTTVKGVSDYAVDKLPGDTVGAYNAAKLQATSLLSDGKAWFAAKRNSYSVA